jgi:cytochrome c oxidase subunit IV
MSEANKVGAVAYVATFAGLLVLATVSLLLSFLHWKVGGLVVSLAIAAVKAVLVLFFFMHLAEQRFTNRMTMLVGAAFVTLLVGLTAADVGTRHTLADRTRPAPEDPFYSR